MNFCRTINLCGCKAHMDNISTTVAGLKYWGKWCVRPTSLPPPYLHEMKIFSTQNILWNKIFLSSKLKNSRSLELHPKISHSYTKSIWQNLYPWSINIFSITIYPPPFWKQIPINSPGTPTISWYHGKKLYFHIHFNVRHYIESLGFNVLLSFIPLILYFTLISNHNECF